MSTPERIQIPAPTGDAFVDYLEVRIAQTLIRKVGRKDEPGRQLAFAMGLASGRWIYLIQQDIPNEIVNPIQFVATMKGRLATLTPEDIEQLMSIELNSAEPAACRRARRALRDILTVD